MPFKRVGKDDYVSPSGRHWTGAQVRLYHATKGFKKKPKRAREVNTVRQASAVHQWYIDTLVHQGQVPMKPPKRRKRLTYERLTPAAILAEEQDRQLREFWTDAARQSSLATRQARAKPRRADDVEPGDTSRAAQAGAVVKGLAAAKRQGKPYERPEAKVDTAGTQRLQHNVAKRQQAGASAQAKDLANVAKDKANKFRAAAARSAARVTAQLRAERVKKGKKEKQPPKKVMRVRIAKTAPSPTVQVKRKQQVMRVS